MTEALALAPDDRVLEIGTGSGYAAAVLSRLAREVFTIERHAPLAAAATDVLERLKYDNVHVHVGDGTLGWPDAAPFDAIVVTAGGPHVPPALLDQLAPGGRLVIPIGERLEGQRLVRIVKHADGTCETHELGAVRFVPLVGAQGWAEARPKSTPATLAHLVREVAEPFPSVEEATLAALVERIGDARVVCLGEATHGTSEFYAFRARLTQELVRRGGFRIVAVEADWPDAARINRWVRSLAPLPGRPWTAFARFPEWMWRNHETMHFVDWLREWNTAHDPVRFYGLDLYALYTSIRLVLEYLDRVDPDTAVLARRRYGGLMRFEADAATYGAAVVQGRLRDCEDEVVAMLRDMLARQVDYAAHDGEHWMDAVGNARLVANAERYYRVMYQGAVESWNLRDRHMFETLESLLAFHGPQARAIVWAHNSHLGDASATEMRTRGELNVGELCRRRFGSDAYLVGFGTDHGTVGAAHGWDEPMRVMKVRAAHPESYERVCHESGVPAFLLPLRRPGRPEVRDELAPPRLERAIGVVYRPDTERQSHYFRAVLPEQFDEWVFIDETSAVHPIDEATARRLPAAHPFAIH